ncbi:MAG TPA: hypothetical protein VFL14_14870 [Xanthomonadales bacterium]|nr:hypothetical protein [Xanthomonadales bacterium]
MANLWMLLAAASCAAVSAGKPATKKGASRALSTVRMRMAAGQVTVRVDMYALSVRVFARPPLPVRAQI